MKKILVFTVICLMASGVGSAQSMDSSKEIRVKGEKFSRNTFYVGVLGPSIPGSINYERIISKNGVVNFGAKIGGFYSSFKQQHDLEIANASFEMNMLIGRSNHLFEMGMGWAGYYGSFYSEEALKTKHYGIPTSTFTMAYRFQKPSPGIFFKVGFTANSLLAFASNDLTELAIGNALLFGFDKITGQKASFNMVNFGIGYSF
ncbi:MAG: hypothetical protein ACOC10_06220 [Bacteroidota bacterium]